MTEEPEHDSPETPDEIDAPETPDEIHTGDDDEEEQTIAQAAEIDGARELLEKAAKEQGRYQRAIERILGPDENRHECPTCEGLGFVWGNVGQGDELPEFVQAEDARPCPKCNALGQTLTGSRQPGHELKPCGECGGRGWLNVVREVATVEHLPTVVAAEVAPIGGQWVPGRGFVPFGSTEPIVADPSVAT